jgi:hypothetical protein
MTGIPSRNDAPRRAERDQDHIAPDDTTVLVDRADPVAVAVERNAKLGLGARDSAWRSTRFAGTVGSG